MWRIAVLSFVLFPGISLSAQAQPQPSQNARQALLEMLFGKAGSLEKHLPDATLAALRKSDPQALTMLQQYSAIGSQLRMQGQELQTFEVGPTLLVLNDVPKRTKFEVIVERDDLQGEGDEIELSFHTYMNGEQQNSFVMPRLTLLMKEEHKIWRLSEITLAVHAALDDPKFLKDLTTSFARNQAAGNEASAVTSVRTINAAEVAYAVTYPAHAYTCSLSDLDGFGSSSTSEHHAMLINSELANGKKSGYVFSLTQCDDTGYKVTAIPAEPGAGPRAFCSDKTGVIRYSEDGKASTCLTSGKPMQ